MAAGLFDPAGKVAVVTGGSRGVGAGIARGLLDHGVKVYVCSRKADELARTTGELATHGDVVGIPADLGTPEGVAAFAAEIADREPRVHALFNNAGATWGAPVETFPAAAWHKVLAINLTGVFLLTQALLPQLRAAATDGDPARVVNIGSVDGLKVPDEDWCSYSYSASKAGVHMLTRHLAADLAPQVTVNALALGLFASKMTAHLVDDGEAPDVAIPLGRIGSPEDLAGAAVFLTSRAGAYLTGAVIPLDGGAALR